LVLFVVPAWECFSAEDLVTLGVWSWLNTLAHLWVCVGIRVLRKVGMTRAWFYVHLVFRYATNFAVSDTGKTERELSPGDR
jgi:hypothetical protein